VTRQTALVFLLFACPLLVFSDVQFAEPDISPQDTLLFRADAEHPGFGTYGTLFWADLEKRAVQQLTFFPEQIALLRGRTVLQIQNRYGVFRSGQDLKGMRAVEQFPSFARGSIIQLGKVIPMQTSPNGRYLIYLRPSSFAFADLILNDSLDGTERVVSENVEISLSGPPSLWSEDSEYLVYAKAGNIYYYSLAQLKEKRVLAYASSPLLTARCGRKSQARRGIRKQKRQRTRSSPLTLFSRYWLVPLPRAKIAGISPSTNACLLPRKRLLGKSLALTRPWMGRSLERQGAQPLLTSMGASSPGRRKRLLLLLLATRPSRSR